MTDPQPAPGDFEYDQAHDSAAPGTDRAGARPAVQVATAAEDPGGADYGYDLSHDVPRTR
ncbi:hypothetical protein CLV35_0991 [Motilibacter peucedani]|uniref:Uncharacterized protein n=1 Tax=Motilibacter peucedani TaxID=598650 RepID=A0A420XUP4_9ACTN|nr:hypothetical protein [Motilibacter peucedani]RKS80554.1 hypothetical protein CLV35_0991 [Motilibacter peucedani]